MPQLKKLAFLLFLLCSTKAFANLSAGIVFEVRSTGSNTNGGCFDPGVTSPGTDFSQQDTAQVAFTDLVIAATTTNLSSVANPFTSASVGNCIQITSGTGFTVGFYEVKSVAGGVATMDRSVGTAASSGGNGNLGGANQFITTPMKAIADVGTQSVANLIWVKAATFTLSATDSTITPSRSYAATLVGYGSTRGDDAARPLITTATNSTPLFTMGGSTGLVFRNFAFSNTATTRSDGLEPNSGTYTFINCTFTGFTSAILTNGTSPHSSISNLTLIRTTVTGGTSSGMSLRVASSGTINIYWSLFSGNAGNGIDVNNGTSLVVSAYDSIFASNTAGCGLSNTTGAIGTLILMSNDFVSNSTSGVCVVSGPTFLQNANNIFYGNGAYGINLPTTGNLTITVPTLANRANAFGGNVTSPRNNLTAGTGDVTLSGNPFTNSAAGDFSLNSTAGAGAVAKQAGFPGVFPGGTSTGFLDIGAIQSNVGGGTTIITNNAGFAY
jgi:hypothetical protein